MRSRLADVAAGRLANAVAGEPETTEAQVMRLLPQIARTGKPGDRLRAIEAMSPTTPNLRFAFLLALRRRSHRGARLRDREAPIERVC